jgi:hypothetical protein
MGNHYDADIVAWAAEQAELLRSRQWSALDIDNIAEEIDSVGRTEKRELGSRMTVLLAHLLKWHFQPEHRSNSWLRTIRHQRKEIGRALQKMPSLRPCLDDPEWLDNAWESAVEWAAKETGIDEFPEDLIWTVQQVIDHDFLPD